MFRLWLRLAGLACAILLAMPAAASQSFNDSQLIEDFEGYSPGTSIITIVALDGTLSGGSVELGTLTFPSSSGTQVYRGSLISFSLADSYCCSWPAVLANVTSIAPVRLRAWKYDYDLEQDVVFFDETSQAGLLNAWLGTGSSQDPLFITRFEYSSTDVFAIDDLKLGLPDVLPGIPEPSSWMMLIAGLGLVGAASRRRQAMA